jgi:hypothetical protein
VCHLYGTDPVNSTSLDLPFEVCKSIFKIPQHVLLVTGDLAFYTDAMGIHASTRHWCLYYMLSCKEWQVNDLSKPGEGWTGQSLEAIQEKLIAELPRKAAIKKEKEDEASAEAARVEATSVSGAPYVPCKKRQRRRNKDEHDVMPPDGKK